MNPLFGKSILIGITGGIAAYKVPLYIRELKKGGAIVKVILTENAKKFVTPLVLSTISDGVFTSLWEDKIPHLSLIQNSPLFVIIPADYNIIGKAASGIADDLLSTVIAAFKGRILFFPSMNYRMFENPIFQKNLDLLKNFGHLIIEPEIGPLALEEEGKGRLPSISRLILETEKALTPDLLKGSYCLITGGGTGEKIDPVRQITNLSSGKMAYSLAKFCYLAGGTPELILGPTAKEPDPNLPYKIKRIESADEMHQEILNRWERVDYLFMSAAVSDFTIPTRRKKIKKKDELVLKLEANIDILEDLKNRKENQFIIGFSIETENLLTSAREKMKEKGCDLMVANEVDAIGSNLTSGIIISPSEEEDFECSKDELAWKIIKKIKSFNS